MAEACRCGAAGLGSSATKAFQRGTIMRPLDLPSMPLYTADIQHDTQSLMVSEFGMYMLLVLYYWSEGDMPKDEQRLATITRISVDDWRKMSVRPMTLFERRRAKID